MSEGLFLPRALGKGPTQVAGLASGAPGLLGLQTAVFPSCPRVSFLCTSVLFVRNRWDLFPLR